MKRIRYADYDVAQICLSGQVVNKAWWQEPQHNRERCSICGAQTIIKCPFCNADISGFYWGSSVPYYERPAFCSSCGQAYPWTEAAVKATKEFAKELFAEEDRNQFADVIENLVRETPRTPLAVERVKKSLEKAGPAVSETFYKITVDVMSEAVKKSIWGR